VQVHIVLRRDHHRGLELARQIGRPQNRLLVGGGDFFLIQPHLGVGAGARQQVFGNRLRPFISLLMQFRLHRVRGAQHVTVDVVGGRQRIQPNRMQQLVSGFQIGFQNAVKLERLTVGDADAAVQRFFTGELVDAEPLLRRHHPARQAAAQHHGMTRFQLLFRAFGANIAVILLIHAVKANQQKVVAVKAAGQAVAQIFRNRAAQVIAFQLHALSISQLALDHQRTRISFAH